MRKHRVCFRLVLLACAAGFAWAGPVTHSVVVNTSSIAGTVGSLDFNFNPGPLITQAASLEILNFAGNGTLVGAPSVLGNVSGMLPAVVTFDNGTPFNDYFQGFKFGTTLSFDVSLFGPALSSPDGTSTSGSTFAFSMFSDAAGTTPVLTTDQANGFAYIVNANLDGTTTVTNFIPVTVPEPSGVLLLATGLALVAVFSGRTNQ
jgi:hypothetical protein